MQIARLLYIGLFITVFIAFLGIAITMDTSEHNRTAQLDTFQEAYELCIERELPEDACIAYAVQMID